jgi:hypothetical protein
MPKILSRGLTVISFFAQLTFVLVFFLLFSTNLLLLSSFSRSYGF